MGPFEFDGGLMLWTVVTFGCLLMILARFVFKPFRRILEQREQSIRDSLEKADKARQDAENILERNEKQLNKARQETRRIINEGHRVVADMRKEAEEKAKEDASTIIDHARAEINTELQKSLSELKSTVVNLSVRISRQIIKEDLDETRHEKLADEFIDRLKKTHAAKREP